MRGSQPTLLLLAADRKSHSRVAAASRGRKAGSTRRSNSQQRRICRHLRRHAPAPPAIERLASQKSFQVVQNSQVQSSVSHCSCLEITTMRKIRLSGSCGQTNFSALFSFLLCPPVPKSLPPE